MKDGYTRQNGTLVDFGVIRSCVMLPFALFLINFYKRPYLDEIEPW